MRLSQEQLHEVIDKYYESDSGPIYHPDIFEYLDFLLEMANSQESLDLVTPENLKYGFRESWQEGFRKAIEIAHSGAQMRKSL